MFSGTANELNYTAPYWLKQDLRMNCADRITEVLTEELGVAKGWKTWDCLN